MLDKNNVVSKSKQLIESKFPDWDAATLNVFDTYLSRINPMNPESSEVSFTKREYEELIGVSEMRPEQLNKCIRKFMGNTVEIPTERGGWENYCLFDKTKFDKNDVGEWEVTLRCHPELKQLFFDLKESGYQKFKLQYTLKLKYKASKLLYYLLKDNQYRDKGIWIVELPELRERLGATAKMYESFKDFNKFILKRAEEEINENTDIKFTYEKVTKGRLTRAVKFIIEQPKENNQLPGQKTIYDYPEVLPDVQLTPKQLYERTVPEGANPIVKNMLDMYAEACNYEFSYHEMDELSIIAGDKVDSDPIMGVAGKQQAVYKYLLIKYKTMCRKRVEGKINKTAFGWLKKSIQDDY